MNEKMNQWLKSAKIRIALILGLYISGLIFLINFNGAFGYYARRSLSLLRFFQSGEMAVLSLLAAGVLSLLLIYCFWLRAGEQEGKPGKYMKMLVKIDFGFLIVMVVYGILTLIVMWQLSYIFAVSIIFVTFLCFLLIVLTGMVGIWHFRNNSFKNAFVLPEFLKAYPVTSRIGGFASIALASAAILWLLAMQREHFFQASLILILAAGALTVMETLPQAARLQRMVNDMAEGKGVKVEAYNLNQLLPMGLEIERLSAAYEEALNESIQAERFKAELITNVSHDIRTPLTSIINYIDLLQTLKIEDETFKTYTTTLERKALRLKTLIDDLLEASKASSGNIEISHESLNLNELTGQVYGEFEERLAEQELEIIIRHPGEGIKVLADGRYLFRIIENLFGNCVKYSLKGSRIYSEITSDQNKVILCLKNVSAQPLDISGDDLMKQFIRGDKARKTEGNGLGLYIAKSLAELMDGKLTVSSSGDLFIASLELPIDK